MKIPVFACAAFWASIFVLLSSSLRAQDDDDPEAGTAPGLIARFRSRAADEAKPAEVERIEAVPRLFALGPAEQPAHELPAGDFQAIWTGLLAVPYPGQYVFTARRSMLENLKIKLGETEVALGQPIRARGRPQPDFNRRSPANRPSGFRTVVAQPLLCRRTDRSACFRHSSLDAARHPPPTCMLASIAVRCWPTRWDVFVVTPVRKSGPLRYLTD